MLGKVLTEHIAMFQYGNNDQSHSVFSADPLYLMDEQYALIRLFVAMETL